MVLGLPYVKENEHMCEGCMLGKQHHEKFKKGGAWRAHNKLEFICSDLYRPKRMASISSVRHFFTLLIIAPRRFGSTL